jgi:hypothetical protein
MTVEQVRSVPTQRANTIMWHFCKVPSIQFYVTPGGVRGFWLQRSRPINMPLGAEIVSGSPGGATCMTRLTELALSFPDFFE